MTSGVLMLDVIRYHSKQPMWIFLIVKNGHISNIS